MASRTATVGSSVGLHARPASVLTAAVADTGLDVTLAIGGGEPVDAGSLLEVMTLGAQHGDVVTITAEGEGAEKALDGLVALIETDLDA